MKRLVLAACLLSASGLAPGFEVTNGPVVINTPPPVVIDPILLQPIGIAIILPKEPMGKEFGLNPAPAIPRALDPGAMLDGERPILTIEEEGVRMPDEQFTLPPE